MKALGVGRYVAIKISSVNEDIGESMQDVEELNISSGDTIFFSPSGITLQGDNKEIFTFVRPEDIYGIVTELS